MSNLDNHINATGSVTIQVIEARTGKVLEVIAGPNLVVTLGRKNICRLLGGDSNGKKISKISLGIGSLAPTLSDTALTSPFTKAIDSVDYPADNQVRFNWSLATTEANGKTIQELGLLNDSDVLFSRKTRAAIVKTSAISLVGNWTITIN